MGDLDTGACSIAGLTGWAAATWSEAEAIADTQDGGRRLSYAALGRAVDHTAAAYVASGLQPGDAVAIWAPNIWEWTVSALAVFRAGCVLVPVNTRFKGREAAYVLGKARCRMLLTVNGFLDTDYPAMLAPFRDELAHLEEVVVLRGASAPATVGCTELLSRATAEATADVVRRSAAADHPDRLDDTSLVMFTSGTTGMPKGAEVRGSAIIAAFAHYTAAIGARPDDRMLVINPFFHAFGFNGATIPCLLSGATIVPHAVFEPTAVLEKIEAERISLLPGPPAIFQALLNHPHLDRYDVSSLRACVTGAASIPEEMVVQMRARLGFERVMTAYGMTETSGLATICRPDDDPKTIATTSGCALEGVELRVVDDAGDDVAVGAPGELLVRGYQVMKGYLDDPEQTAAAIDAAGWLHTGDVVVMDDRGYIDITDRKKDMFIVGGFNVYPAEIERVMIEHPAVGQVAVVGVDDERLGEVGVAFVVPAPGDPPDHEALIAWCREQMANYKVPRRIWLVDSLPLNPSGKVLKYELRAQAQAWARR
jgi:acyl-CoA synthetase (AMP-forming)/AMP-acid ligase II